MPNYVPLNLETYADAQVDPTVYLKIARSYKTCPVVTSETFAAAGSFPLFAIKNEQTGQLVLSALFALMSSKNLFCVDEKWEAPYTPINVKRYPFGVAMSADGQSGGDILIDADAVTDASTRGQALFTAAEEPSPFLQSHQKALGLLASEQKSTLETMERLSLRKLLIEIELSLTLSQSTQKNWKLVWGESHKVRRIDRRNVPRTSGFRRFAGIACHAGVAFPDF